VREKRLNEIKGVILFALGLMVLASLIRFERLDLSLYTSHPNIPPKNLLGIFGAYLGEVITFLLGRPTSFVLPVLILLLSIKYFRQQSPYLSIPRILGMLILLLSISSLIGMFSFQTQSVRFYLCGFSGYNLANFITAYFSRLGGFIIFITFGILSFALVTETLISSIFLGFFNKAKAFFAAVLKLRRDRPVAPVKIKPIAGEAPDAPEKKETLFAGLPSLLPRQKIKTRLPVQELKVKQKEVKIGDYHLPSLDLLDAPVEVLPQDEGVDLEDTARVLEETLADFGISAKVTDIVRGPIITRFELEPAPGVKVNSIENLSDDIALGMKAQSVRIIAPIPGKARVGVEVPNAHGSFVYLKDVLESKVFQEAKSKLTLALGKDITGHSVVTDLDEMPHLLIAGTTGSGKTVCVNSLVLSLLYKASPSEVKFIMVDPKRVELMPYNGLPHLLCPVVTDHKKVSAALNWTVNEMSKRYDLLQEAGARNIEAYNEKREKLPYIVVIIDEFADLMSIAGVEIENAVTRLAQLSRAVGIHLILATQRPSVNVVTGVLKANLPARISFKVASKVDSRTVLDKNGAEALLGKGDMLFQEPGKEELFRLQGTFIKDPEIERVVEFIRAQGEPVYDEEILKEQQKSQFDTGEKDELYDEAARVIMESNQASVSILQRRMRLGYTRAARIIDTMEQEGLVGPFEGSKPRKILVNREDWLARNAAERKAVTEAQEQ
jgi:S-DNA-T family DNA segregation ATPase FtsK/SpoIIIE